MVKIEVIREPAYKGGLFRVQATFREPFEYFFEIAQHNARFEHPRDAARLAERVRKAIKENGLARSYSFVIGRNHWSYSSSACKSRLGSESETFVVPASETAKALDLRAA